MSVSPLLRVMNSEPIDRLARIVTSQYGCEGNYEELSMDDLCKLLTRLIGKKRAIRDTLPVGPDGWPDESIRSPEMREYIVLWHVIGHLRRQLGETRKKHWGPKWARRILPRIEEEWKREHPGFVWDGRQLVAPNGAVFDRAAAIEKIQGQR